MFGIGGRKAAKDFTPVERRGQCRHKYGHRKLVAMGLYYAPCPLWTHLSCRRWTPQSSLGLYFLRQT
jgi:hypothetical protein